ncbi:hypothetical protein F2Q70_00033106 [Brassica cretica]|uniref:Uncharacterized protein n=1 Tax=Brassica cretica TaxID=69181 RepID=A0A8S9FEY2_BRACR|nr:hypothetical protein F2Q70_00033106 [Brassica cretica]
MDCSGGGREMGLRLKVPLFMSDQRDQSNTNGYTVAELTFTKLKQQPKKKTTTLLFPDIVIISTLLFSEVGALHSSTLSFTEEHMAENVKEHGDGSAELVKSMGDNKYASLMRPAGRYYSAIKDVMVCGKGRYTLVKDVDDVENGAYDKPLPCFGCGIGWFS